MGTNKIRLKWTIPILLALMMVNVLEFTGGIGSIIVYAKDNSSIVTGNIFELDEDNPFDFEGETSDSTTALGAFSLTGDLTATTDTNSVPSYTVNSGNIAFSYSIDLEVLERSETEWHLIDDKSKIINDLKLNDNILSGALIVQTSLDGEIWNEEIVETDIFATGIDLPEKFYNTKNIQLENGCYYRVVIAYKMRMKLDDKKILFINRDNYEYKKIGEIYKFYLSSEANGTTAQDIPRKELGNKINTGKDNGYSGSNAINSDDPHYGWEIGTFFVNGYTRDTKNDTGIPVFLKNVGDKVTLWFNLSQDINCLNGKDNLTVPEDINGYDQAFETKATNLKHGALIIQYTDNQGVKHEPMIYTDYLAANAKIGADTRVQLFEEGDYAVSLDYEIKDITGPFSAIAKYSNYKIAFEFSIRNGNCMVYPFDTVTGDELADNAITSNGFKLDMAKSKYLTIDVTKSVLKEESDGLLTKDIRFNRPASDGEEYKDEGIYTFDVTNLYTGQHTVKTVYIGSGGYLKSLSVPGMSLDELNEQLKLGAKVKEDGTIVDVISELALSSEKIRKNKDVETVTAEAITTSTTLFVIAGLVFVVCIIIALIVKKQKVNLYDKKDREEGN